MDTLELEGKEEPPSLVSVERALIRIEGVLPARALTRVRLNVSKSPPATSQADRAESRSLNTHVLLANFSNETLTVPKATILGIAEEVSEALIEKFRNQTHVQSANKTA